MKKTKFIKDVLLSIIASAIPTFVLQFVLYPTISKQTLASDFGLMLSLIGIINIIRATLGGSLNNARLLNQKDFDNDEENYNFVLILNLMLSVLVITIITVLYEKDFNLSRVLLMITISTFFIMVDYMAVYYRLKLDYKNNLVVNIFLVAGYLTGYLFYNFTGYWHFILLFGSIFAFSFSYYKTKLIKVKFKKNRRYKIIFNSFLILSITNLLSQSLSRIDRILLYPILGGESTTLYYIITLMGKTLLIAIVPLSGVLLSYLIKMKRLNKLQIHKINIFSIIFSPIIMLIIYITSLIILPFLYDEYIHAVKEYLIIGAILTTTHILKTIYNPLLLKMAHVKWKLIIMIVNIVLYLVLGILFSHYYNLIGFMFAIITSNLISLVFTIIVIYNFTEGTSTDKAINDLA